MTQRRGPTGAAGREPPLLPTKLRAPHAGRRVLPRPNLLDQLSLAAEQRRLTIVSAPPGWGKTTLLTEWCAHVEPESRCAWVGLDRADADPIRFWTYIVESLRTVAPQIGNTALRLLAARGTSVVDAFLPELVRDLDRLEESVVLIVDDYHLAANPEIDVALGFLIEHLPPTLHLVIASRSDPGLPLARLRVREELAEIRAGELRFSAEEATAFLNDLLGLGLSPDDALRLQQRTEGWVAGLYLAALSLRGRSDARAFVEQFTGDHRHVVDYLGAEVLDNQDDRTRTFLLQTSILNRLSGPLCDAVTGRGDSTAVLDEIERSNLFLVPLDSRRRWYRYHHLFGELLRHELSLSQPQLVPELHRRASEWHRDHGSVGPAIEHAVAAGHPDRAAELIAQEWNGVFNRGHLTTVTGWLDALPESRVTADARLCIARAWIAMDRGRLDEAEPWIARAERAVRGDAEGSVGAQVAILRAVQRFKTGDLRAASRAARRAVELATEEFSETVGHCLLGITLFWRGDLRAAETELRRAVELADRSDNELAGIYARGYRALARAERAELASAETLAEDAVFRTETPAVAEHFVTMMAHVALGRARELRGSAGDSEQPFARAVELARRGAGAIELAHSLVLLALVRQSRGDLVAARALAREARTAVADCRDIGILGELLESVERRLQLAPQRPHVRSPRSEDELTERELAVLRLLPTDLSQREIGAALYLSLNTVKTHARSLYQKLHASSRTEAVERARELGLV